MNELQVFENEEFGTVRTLTIDNEPWFVGKDVTEALGFVNSRDAIATHVFLEDKGVEIIDTLGGKQTMTIINESGLYALVFGSRLESAKRFKHWVTSEVLPSIRKTGSYQMQPEGKKLLALAVLEAQKVIEEQTVQIEEMKPKAIFADAVAASDTSILVGELAKLLRQNGFHTGQNRLFAILRDQGYLIKGGSSKNMPTQTSVDRGLFEIKETIINNPDGSIKISKTPKVTRKGQQHFINKFLGGRKDERNICRI